MRPIAFSQIQHLSYECKATIAIVEQLWLRNPIHYSLGKSLGKEVVSDSAILAQQWSKIAARKTVNLGLFFTYHFTGLH